MNGISVPSGTAHLRAMEVIGVVMFRSGHVMEALSREAVGIWTAQGEVGTIAWHGGVLLEMNSVVF
jgi:hypothetical protein